MKKHTILFLAANPDGLTARKLDEEAREIQEELRRASQRDRFEFVPRLAAQPMDLLRALREIKPSIVHFVGHAEAGGIVLASESGRPMQVTDNALHATFGSAGQTAQIVVLNGCATEDLAKALCDIVPICVGTPASISDAAARAFSVGFYGALASSEPVPRACSQGEAAMHLEVIGEHAPPLLYHRRDVAPETLILAEVPDAATSTPHTHQLAAVIENYRKRKSGSFERWDLRTAGPTPTTGNRPSGITLDDMYIPLRFDPQVHLTDASRGAPIRSDDLFKLPKPLVLVGVAGSGKTTWMRWTFRRLIQDLRAVPFFLELRTIGAAWKTPQDAARPIERYLADALSECGAPDPNVITRALLASTSGPRPVILIDGWDELGDQGERLRERLVELCRAFPHVIVLVSSRPFGETRPAGTEGFETTYIQPLSDEDIQLLAARFYRRVHGQDEVEGLRSTNEFMNELAAAPDARSLAGTVLLLTMMLLLSHEGPLPDRRHNLYTACLRNMLLQRVTQRERDGVQIDHDQQWRPENREERLRAAAALAYRMQCDGYSQLRRGAVICDWSDAIDLLGDEWTRDQRERFLRWLIASAGILIDQTDGSIRFSHLSFQEYLSAYYLFITREGDERVAAMRSHMSDISWWETLRLWTALIGDHGPDKLSPMLDVLRANTRTYWLAGHIFADGTGRSADFEVWLAELPARLSDPFTIDEGCAWSWGTCKQEDRRNRIARSLTSARETLHWLDGTLHARWCDLAKLKVDLAPALLVLAAPINSAAAVACSRVLHGTVAGWPDGRELAMLRLWPSTRVEVGARLQTAISLGAHELEIEAMLPSLLVRTVQLLNEASPQVEYFAKILSHRLGRHFGEAFGSFLGRDRGRYLGRRFGRRFGYDLARCFIRNFGDIATWSRRQTFADHFERYVSRRFFGDFFGADSGFNFGSNLIWNFIRNLGPEFDNNWARDFGFPDSILAAPWFPIFEALEARSLAGRASPRATLAHGRLYGSVPLLVLFRAACRASFTPGDKKRCTAVARVCDEFDGDPMWPALARHVARISTNEDRVALEDLARHPEKREPPLGWGLQHYVRGDLVFEDGSVVTLDELCAKAGLEPLPLLEAMPEELDLPLATASE